MRDSSPSRNSSATMVSTVASRSGYSDVGGGEMVEVGAVIRAALTSCIYIYIFFFAARPQTLLWRRMGLKLGVIS
jgi:hypothetical protein